LAATQAELDALESESVEISPSWEPDAGQPPPAEPPPSVFDTLEPIADTADPVPGDSVPSRDDPAPPEGDGGDDPPSSDTADRDDTQQPAARREGGVDLHVAVAVARTPLVERLRAGSGAAARLRLLDDEIGQVARMDPPRRLGVIRAVPDGWARRRAIERLIAASALPPDEVPAVVATLTSEVARSWVCASAIEAGLLDARDHALEGLVGSRAVHRLRRRYGTPKVADPAT
jgi:hypothetical protein